MIQVKNFVFNPFLENTLVLYDETKEAIIIDPGCYENYEKSELTSFIKNEELKPVRLINTHCHIDHVFGNHFVMNHYNLKLEAHENEVATLGAVKAYAPSYGFQHFDESKIDSFLSEEDQIEFGNSKLEIVFVPGHAPGHIAFYNLEDKVCIGGDVLFKESIGRTDLPGGDHNTLLESIRSKLFNLPDDMMVYPGHGDTTTIGHEKKYNPFCAIV